MQETLITKYAYSYDQKDRNYLPYQDNTVTFLRGRAVLYSATWTHKQGLFIFLMGLRALVVEVSSSLVCALKPLLQRSFRICLLPPQGLCHVINNVWE